MHQLVLFVKMSGSPLLHLHVIPARAGLQELLLVLKINGLLDIQLYGCEMTSVSKIQVLNCAEACECLQLL